MGLWARTAFWIGDHTVVPFRVTFKLLPLAADVLGVWVIYALAKKRGGELHAWRAAAVFSTSLVSIAITGHHGNTDSACAVLTLAAVALIADGRSPFVAGRAFVAARRASDDGVRRGLGSRAGSVPAACDLRL